MNSISYVAAVAAQMKTWAVAAVGEVEADSTHHEENWIDGFVVESIGAVGAIAADAAAVVVVWGTVVAVQ